MNNCFQIKFIFLFLFGCFISTGYAQINNVEVKYRIRLETREEQKDRPLPERIRNVFSQAKSLELTLLYEDNKAVFFVEDALESDINNGGYSRSIILKLLGIDSRYYQDFETNYIYEEKKIDRSSFLIKTKIDSEKWVLTDEFKYIGGYKCYKATTSYKFKARTSQMTDVDVIAWYTPSLPIASGPKSFCGLPGLILQLEERNQIYYFVNLNLNPKNEMQKPFLPQEKHLTREEFDDIAQKKYSKVLEN